MSWETQSWAARMRPGSASAKLVLLGFASCADANHCAFPSIDWLCEFSDLNRKTVISAVERLCASGLMEDTGERRGRTRQVKVYRLATNSVYRATALTSDPATDPKVDGQKRATETVPKSEQYQKRNSSTFSGKESQNRDTEPFREPIPPTETIVSVCPQGPKHTASKTRKEGGTRASTRLPDDWAAPELASLPDAPAKLVAQWPPFAYQLVAEGFRLHFLAEAGVRAVKRDWAAAFGKWLITAHPRVMRDAKVGVKFSEIRKPGNGMVGVVSTGHWAVAGEDDRSQEVRLLLASTVPEQTFRHWLAPLAWIIRDDGTLLVIGASSFTLDLVKDKYGTAIVAAARKAIGSAFAGVVYTVERVKDGARSQGEEHGQEQRDDHGGRQSGGGRAAAGASGDHARRPAEVRA